MSKRVTVNVRCSQGPCRDQRKLVEELDLGDHEMLRIPCVGEYITPFDDGWAGMRVQRVFFGLGNGKATVYVETDTTGEIARELKIRRGEEVIDAEYAEEDLGAKEMNGRGDA